MKTIIPANPGFWLFGGQYPRPILAWAMDADGCTRPITIHGPQDLTGSTAILQPDGLVYLPVSGTWYDSTKRYLDESLPAE